MKMSVNYLHRKPVESYLQCKSKEGLRTELNCSRVVKRLCKPVEQTSNAVEQKMLLDTHVPRQISSLNTFWVWSHLWLEWNSFQFWPLLVSEYCRWCLSHILLSSSRKLSGPDKESTPVTGCKGWTYCKIVENAIYGRSTLHWRNID